MFEGHDPFESKRAMVLRCCYGLDGLEGYWILLSSLPDVRLSHCRSILLSFGRVHGRFWGSDVLTIILPLADLRRMHLDTILLRHLRPVGPSSPK
jgi:hypothetical protein